MFKQLKLKHVLNAKFINQAMYKFDRNSANINFHCEYQNHTNCPIGNLIVRLSFKR